MAYARRGYVKRRFSYSKPKYASKYKKTYKKPMYKRGGYRKKPVYKRRYRR